MIVVSASGRGHAEGQAPHCGHGVRKSTRLTNGGRSRCDRLDGGYWLLCARRAAVVGTRTAAARFLAGAVRSLASTPPAASHPRQSGVEAFWNSRSHDHRSWCLGQFQLSLSRFRAGPCRSGEVAQDPTAPANLATPSPFFQGPPLIGS